MSFTITRLSAPSFWALDNAAIAEWLRIDTETDQTTIEMLVSASTEVVEGLTNSAIGLSSYRIDYDLRLCSYRLPLCPVQSVTSVEYLDDAGNLQPLAYTLRSGLLTLSDGLPPAAITVTLIAGYPDVASIPDALRWAISLLVSAGYNGREAIDPASMLAAERLCARYRRIIL
jgi:uncharacterized phiE125 gp8 family phage protein